MLTALLIMLREGFEAALVVAIVYAYPRKRSAFFTASSGPGRPGRWR
jgi:high-affinity Fe2+/Pb2+ permease